MDNSLKTPLAACLKRLGLSQGMAAEILGVGVDAIKSWRIGRNPTPASALDRLREYESEIIDISKAMQESWKDAGDPLAKFADITDHQTAMAYAHFILSGGSDEKRRP